MRRITAKQWVHLQWAKGKNPIHLFGNVYLVRKEPTYFSKWPIYVIKIFKDFPIDKSENI